jgi:hypothetical protein
MAWTLPKGSPIFAAHFTAMQLKRIQEYFGQYQGYLKSRPAQTERLPIWESQRVFQDNWDIDAEDWPGMYDRSLQNSTTKRLWKREAYEPKRMMLELMRMQPDFTRHMFVDLFNEEKSMEGRAGRFVYYCDMLLQEYKDNNPRSIDNNHYHDDNYQMVSLYMAFRYPDRYAYYEADAFRSMLEKLGSTQLPETNDLERYAKVTQTLYKLMAKEEGLLGLHQKRLQAGLHYSEESRLVVWDFCKFVAG